MRKGTTIETRSCKVEIELYTLREINERFPDAYDSAESSWRRALRLDLDDARLIASAVFSATGIDCFVSEDDSCIEIDYEMDSSTPRKVFDSLRKILGDVEAKGHLALYDPEYPVSGYERRPIFWNDFFARGYSLEIVREAIRAGVDAIEEPGDPLDFNCIKAFHEIANAMADVLVDYAAKCNARVEEAGMAELSAWAEEHDVFFLSDGRIYNPESFYKPFRLVRKYNPGV